KGTIGRILRALAGAPNVTMPTLSQLQTEFGLAPLIGKRIAIIGDARLGKKSDPDIIVERLLTITGEDGVDVNRKNLPHWSGQLKVRLSLSAMRRRASRMRQAPSPGASLCFGLSRPFTGRKIST